MRFGGRALPYNRSGNQAIFYRDRKRRVESEKKEGCRVALLLGSEKVTVDFPAKTVLDEVTIGIMEGDRIGIVGRNGDGKSTLLSVLAGRLRTGCGPHRAPQAA